jgi:CRISPR/Cas system-associated protein Csm6
MGLWLVRTFTPSELYSISQQPDECMHDYLDHASSAQVLMKMVEHDPTRFSTVFRILACSP